MKPDDIGSGRNIDPSLYRRAVSDARVQLRVELQPDGIGSGLFLINLASPSHTLD